MLAVLTVSAVISYYRALHFANLAYDRTLYRTVLALSDEIEVNEKNQVEINLPEVAKNLLNYDDDDKVYFRISSPDGTLVLGEEKLAFPLHKPKSNQHVYFDSAIDGQRIRGVAFALPIEGAKDQGDIMVELAETTSKRDAMVTEIVEEMIAPQIFIMLIAAFMIEFSIRHTLKPLQELHNAIEQRSHQDLSPISIQHNVTELKPMLDAMNALLTRLRATVQQQQRFIADASHQMRTPIAGLQTQAELALREAQTPQQKNALELMISSTKRLSHLLKRLLSLASVDTASGRETPLQKLDMKIMAEEISMLWVNIALQKNIDFGLDISPGDYLYIGDPIMLGELLSNLIDNAIQYTPEGGIINVKLSTDAQSITLQVIDSGVGIAPNLRQKVFERFHRISQNQGKGCGLGLAIVAEVAQRHQASIQVEDGLKHPTLDSIGCQFTVKFNRNININ